MMNVLLFKYNVQLNHKVDVKLKLIVISIKMNLNA